jgi:hypothetical protein
MSPFTALDPKRLGVLVGAFSSAFFETPESDDLVARTRATLEALSDDVVRELGEAMEMLAALAEERLGEPSGEAPATVAQPSRDLSHSPRII